MRSSRVDDNGLDKFLGLEIKYLPEGKVLEIVGSITIFEILSIVGFVFFLATLAIAVKNSSDATKTRRAEFSFRVWEAFMSDEVQKAFLEIEWERFRYPQEDGNAFSSDEEERRIDRLLYLFDEIAFFAKIGVLLKSDVQRWGYQGRRVFQDPGIQSYLAFLDTFFEENGQRKRPHDLARKLFGDPERQIVRQE